MRNKEELVENLQTLELMFNETQEQYRNALITMDKENMRIQFFNKCLLEARIKLMRWVMGENGFPI